MTRADSGPHRVAIGLGGNIGDVSATMRSALTQLEAADGIAVVRVSGLYRTPPWGKTDQAFFYNACAMIETSVAPEDLLGLLLDTERALKRDRRSGERWGPRTIDLDLLWYDGVTLASEDLILPHPRIAERAFVLVPLAEIAPDLQIDGRAVADLARHADDEGIERIQDGDWWRA
ncbi:2-amino-4-hydroxy-6-hydroxymethyldihydropteridine diphosphokinase [Pararhizobium haloflavum]|uniref:2-amino-4-hydroxy-6- hydroxymethyldihydropteridine diphosphokinase n=1 Tax=Pararhizobium haloflavum TaxID=2037914 RepID=UPI000C18904A|nr:2-amino-4-hydroxy-6-hydroxymethyldihydropteridine diphosphokinase [Pararhizobium haloflavum]